MAITKPYFRIYRPFSDGNYLHSIEGSYINDDRYSSDRVDLIRGYHLLEKELMHLFEFVEPTDKNLDCYSHQIYALLLRASTEFELNARSILKASGYSNPKKTEKYWNIKDYYKLNVATRLAEYVVRIPIWNGTRREFKPFEEWKTGHSLSWYQAYNKVKHNRFGSFSSASLENAVKAVGAVFAILFAQFNAFAFSSNHPVSSIGIDNNLMYHDSCLLAVELPTSWTSDGQYDFDWMILKLQHSPFQAFPF